MNFAGVARTWMGASEPSTGTLYTSVRRPVGKSALSTGSWMAAEKSTDLPSALKASGVSVTEL